MKQRRLSWIVLLACLPATGALADAPIEAGPLPPAGDAPLHSPAIEAYGLDGHRPHAPGAIRLPSTLGRVDTPETPLRLRGARDVQIYRTLVPAVALIVTDDGEGSGSLIATKPTETGGRSGVLLTNAHVVGEAAEVAVVFKPQNDGDKAKAIRGIVRKIDPERDLALVEIETVPANVATIPLGTMNEAQVGADVHSIGHPLGQTWTYTKGLISQVRRDYHWMSHKADVIQTQTPLNPGNSGGPLISDSGRLIGVNAFKQEGEALNFAVAVNEVETFLKAAQDGAYEPKRAAAACKPKVDYEGRNKADNAFIRRMDIDCSGEVNAVLIVPDDKSYAVEMWMDGNRDGKADAWILDKDRDGKWDVSYWDTDFDGKPDLVGYHPDGGLTPARVEKYQPQAATTLTTKP